jgi:hypothetical protein
MSRRVAAWLGHAFLVVATVALAAQLAVRTWSGVIRTFSRPDGDTVAYFGSHP